LSLCLITGFSFLSFASGGAGSKISDGGSFLTGTLNGRGEITINGNEAKPGATILSGNSIVTGSNGHATIELVTLGRVDLEPKTGVTTTFTSGFVQNSLDQCGTMTQYLPPGVTGIVRLSDRERTHVTVKMGSPVTVQHEGGPTIVKPGETKTFDKATEVNAQGEVLFKINCGRDAPLAAYWVGSGAGVVGLLGYAVGKSGNKTNEEIIRPTVSPTAP
jgi:hypothetical protein